MKWQSRPDRQTGLPAWRESAICGFPDSVIRRLKAHVDGPWLSAHMSDEQGAPIPGQVAEKLVGQRFSTFRELREAFWKTVAQTPELASEFQKQNLRFMQNGNALYPPNSEQVIIGSTGELSDRTFELHHDPAIVLGGAVYDLSTIRVVTPSQHDTLGRKEITQ